MPATADGTCRKPTTVKTAVVGANGPNHLLGKRWLGARARPVPRRCSPANHGCVVVATVVREALVAAVVCALLAPGLAVAAWIGLAVRTVAGAHRRARRRPASLRGLDGWLSPASLADLDEALDRVALEEAAGRRVPPAPHASH